MACIPKGFEKLALKMASIIWDASHEKHARSKKETHSHLSTITSIST